MLLFFFWFVKFEESFLVESGCFGMSSNLSFGGFCCGGCVDFGVGVEVGRGGGEGVVGSWWSMEFGEGLLWYGGEGWGYVEVGGVRVGGGGVEEYGLEIVGRVVCVCVKYVCCWCDEYFGDKM